MRILIAIMAIALLAVPAIAQDTPPQKQALYNRLESRYFAADRFGENRLRIYYLNREAEAVTLSGTFSINLDPLYGQDSGLWYADFTLENLDRALLTFIVSPVPGGWQERYYYRGPEAPAAIGAAETLGGSLHHHVMNSVYLNEPRTVSVYLPPKEVEGVIFLADGQMVQKLAYYLDPLLQSGDLPQWALAGSHAARPASLDGQVINTRAVEYLEEVSELGNAEARLRFDNHMRFFTEEFIPWAIRHHSLPSKAENHWLAGFSMSGSFALSCAFEHPDRFQKLLIFSPVWRPTFDDGLPENLPDAVFVYGSLEGPLQEKIQSLNSRWPETSQMEIINRVAGHDEILWLEEIVRILLN